MDYLPKPLKMASITAFVISSALALLLALSVWPFDGEYSDGWYPGAIAIYILLALLFTLAPWRARLNVPVIIALSSLAALGLWTFFSMLWSPVPDRAFHNGELTFLYLAIFIIGLWLVQLKGKSADTLLLPLAIAGSMIAIVTTAVLAGGSNVDLYFTLDNTLRFPIGSRSSNAAFFLILFWPTLIIASKRGLSWKLRAPLLGSATLMLELAILSQSRASVVAATVATVVYIALSRSRLRASAYLLLAAIPAAVSVPWLLDVFAGGLSGEVPVSLLHTATGAMAISTFASVVACAVASRTEKRLSFSPITERRVKIAAVAAVALLAVSGSVAFISAEGNPARWLENRYYEFKEGGDPSFTDSGSRFTADATTNRSDAWRVALKAARSDPLLGTGAGGFLLYDLRERRSGSALKDPHNIALSFLSELGIPGLLLFIIFTVAIFLQVAGSRRNHRSAEALTMVALVAFSYWLVQALLDPLWSRPAVTAPVIGLLGMAAASSLVPKSTSGRSIYRLVPAALALLLALVAVPAYQSDRLTRSAYKIWDHDRSIDKAYQNLDRAEGLNPLADGPLIAKGLIARRASDTGTALDSFRKAIAQNPEYWLPHEQFSRLIRHSKPVLALKEQQTALRLNPKNKRVRQDLFLLYLKNADRVRSDSVRRAYVYTNKAHELMPKHVAPLMSEGYIALYGGDRKRAIRAFRRAIALDPGFWQPHYEIGVLLEQSDPVEAEKQLSLARKLKKRSSRKRRSQ